MKWITDTEPEENVFFLLQTGDMYFQTKQTKGVWIGKRVKNYYSVLTPKGWEDVYHPLAWMPLPEPYRRDDE